MERLRSKNWKRDDSQISKACVKYPNVNIQNVKTENFKYSEDTIFSFIELS